MSGPQITIADIQNKIIDIVYTRLSDGRTTICQLTLENGYTVLGESSCVCAENYNRALGERYAYDDAVKNVWPLEGYLLSEKLYREAKG